MLNELSHRSKSRLERPSIFRRRMMLTIGLISTLAMCLLQGACTSEGALPLPTLAATTQPLPTQLPEVPTATPNISIDATIASDVVETIKLESPFVGLVSPYVDPVTGTLIQNVPYSELMDDVEYLQSSPEYAEYYSRIVKELPAGLMDSLVLINLQDENGFVYGLCSGVFLGYDTGTSAAYVLTNSHCVVKIGEALPVHPQGVGNFVVGNYEPTNITLNQPHLQGISSAPFRVAGNTLIDPRTDLAMIRLPNIAGDFSTKPWITMDTDGTVLGENVYSVGFPYFSMKAHPLMMTIGEPIGLADRGYAFNTLIGSEPLFPGMSGGPVFSTEGFIGTVSGVVDSIGSMSNSLFTPLRVEDIGFIINQFPIP